MSSEAECHFINRGGVIKFEHNMDDLRVDQRRGYLTTGTFLHTFHLMNHTSL